MKLKLMILFSILLASGIGAIFVFIPLKQQKDQYAQQALNANQKAQTLQNQLSSVQSSVGKDLQEVKMMALDEKQSGQVFFSAKSTQLPGGDTQIEITLDGNSATSVDAVDLVLTYNNDTIVKEIKKGTAFPSYPRSLSKNGGITITGIALPMGNTISYGKVGNLFVTLVVNKKPGTTLILNTKDTQAYFNGTPILDFARTFKTL